MTGYSESVKRVWNEWQLSGLVLSSLFLQLLLILTAHWRKTKPYRACKIFYWLAYLSAAYVATYCLGIISQDSCKYKSADPDMQLKAFWASILLFHLGGLDNFTALTLEDNQLWLRHAIELFLQTATTVYIFIRFLPVGGYRGLLLPFIFIFVAASLKCFEQAWALKQGSMEGLRESMLGEPEPGPEYADTMDRYIGKLRSGEPPLLNINEEFRQATSMLEHPKPSQPHKVNKESRLPTSMVWVANPSVPVVMADIVDGNSTLNSSLQSSTTSLQAMRPSSSSRNNSDIIPTANEFFLRSKDREQTELASEQSSKFVSSSGVNSSNSTETMITSSSMLHSSIHHPSLATEAKVDGVTQHHHSTPDPSLPSSSSTHQIMEGPQSSNSPQNSSQNSSSTAMEDRSIEIIPTAYELFSRFKGVLVDGIFSFQEREWSQAKFLAHSWKWAFNVIETEQSFAYDVLYTKASISRTSMRERGTTSQTNTKERGIISQTSIKERGNICPTSVKKGGTISRTGGRGGAIRVLSLVLTVSTVLLFAFHAVRIDEFLLRHRCIITFVLLAGAVFVDIMTLLQFFRSDWSFIDGSRQTDQKFVSNARWSNLMSQYNLISFCLKNRPSTFDKILGVFGLKESWDHYRYTRFVSVEDELKEFLFTELCHKAKVAKESKDYKQFIICKGDWALERVEQLDRLRWSVIKEADFDESLLIWHIATDLCYRSEKLSSCSNTVPNHAEMARNLSDYMLYLLVVRPLMLSSSTVMGTKRFRDTCAEVRNYFQRHASYPDERTASAMLLRVETPLRPLIVKGDRSKSVLWDGCILAKQLGLVDPPEKRWKIMCKVWVEMLCHAGIHCRGYYHAEQLRAGGELLTFACFLMTHLGMGKHYKIEIGESTANIQTYEKHIVITLDRFSAIRV